MQPQKKDEPLETIDYGEAKCLACGKLTRGLCPRHDDDGKQCTAHYCSKDCIHKDWQNHQPNFHVRGWSASNIIVAMWGAPGGTCVDVTSTARSNFVAYGTHYTPTSPSWPSINAGLTNYLTILWSDNSTNYTLGDTYPGSVSAAGSNDIYLPPCIADGPYWPKLGYDAYILFASYGITAPSSGPGGYRFVSDVTHIVRMLYASGINTFAASTAMFGDPNIGDTNTDPRLLTIAWLPYEGVNTYAMVDSTGGTITVPIDPNRARKPT